MKKRIVFHLSLCILCLALLLYGIIRMILHGVETYLVINGLAMIILFIGALVRLIDEKRKGENGRN